MDGMTRKTIISFLTIISFFSTAYTQTARIKGKVIDAESGEAIPYANVFIAGTSVFAITDDSGSYYIETRLKLDTLTATFLGYSPLYKKFTPRVDQQIDFALSRNTTNLEEIVVRPGENPAHPILEKIIKHKEFNSRRSHSLQCNVYNKMQVSLTNVDEKFKNRRILRPYQFVFDNVDTNKQTGATYLPLLISETFTEYKSQSDPFVEENIVKAHQMSGLNEESLTDFAGKLSQNFDIYDNYMTLYTESGFVSPISNTGLLFYRYYLTDSSFHQGHKVYKIDFKPRRKQERTFTGFFWVADTSYAIESLQMKANPEANINFITNLSAEYEYKPVSPTVWMLSKEKLSADFNLTETKIMKGFHGEKTTIYSNYKLNKLLKPEEPKAITDSAINTANYVAQNRPVALSNKEQKIYLMADSIKNVPAFRTTYDILYTIVDAHYNFKNWKVGPYFSIYSFNMVEGHRFRVGGASTTDFSSKINLTGYGAYGTKDKDYKYFGKVIWNITPKPLVRLTSLYRHDISQLNLEPGESLNENIVSSILRRNEFLRLQMINNFNTSVETDITKSITGLFYVNYMKVFTAQYVPLINRTDNSLRNSVTTNEFGLGLHLEYKQQFFNMKYSRARLQNNYPSFDIKVAKATKGVLGAEYDYWRMSFTMRHYLPTNPMGFNKYTIEAGTVLGNTPWPLLYIPRGNETYGLNRNTYNMMNFYEFAASDYLAFGTEQHFQGFFLNYFPGIRRLRLREVASARAIIGRMGTKDVNEMSLPNFMYSLNKPYVEVSVGIENIFRLIRIDAMWRLTHRNNPNIETFGIRTRIEFML